MLIIKVQIKGGPDPSYWGNKGAVTISDNCVNKL